MAGEAVAKAPTACTSKISKLLSPEAKCFWAITLALAIAAPATMLAGASPLGYLAAFTLLFLLPGYAVLHAAYPTGTGRDIVDLAISLALSTAITGLSTLALASVPPGVTREKLVGSMAAVTLLAALVCLARLPAEK